MAVHLMSGEVCGFCLHWYVCVPCVSPWACVCVCFGAIPASLSISVPILSAYAPGILCVLYFSSEDILLAPWMWCESYPACLCVAPGVPTCVGGFMNKVRRVPLRPTISSGGFVSGSPLHTLPCVCGPRAFVRVRSPCASEVCVHLGSSVCPLAPPCPRVPCAEPGSCVLESRGHPRLHPGAPGGRPRGTHGRGWTHRPAGAGRWEGAVAAGSAGTSPRQTGGRAGGRRRPRVRAGAGAPRSPPPARGLGSPRPAPELPKCNFPCRRLAARGAFPGGFWTEEGETRRRPQNEVSAGAGRARGASGAGAARGEGARRGGAAAGPAAAPSRTCSRPGGGRPGLCSPALHCCGGWGRGAGRPWRLLCVSPSPRGAPGGPDPPLHRGRTQKSQASRGPPGAGRAEMPLRGGDAG